MQFHSNNSTDDTHAIEHLIHSYFDGLHRADTEQLASLFSSDCVLKAPGIRRSKAQWLALVQDRPTPEARGDKQASEIISIEVVGNQAMVKAKVPVLDDIFIDYLGLLYENGRWLIVNKMYADLPTSAT